MKYEIDKKGYDTLGLSYGEDVLESLECELHGYSYICDGISEQADSCVDIYNSDLWDKAKTFEHGQKMLSQKGLWIQMIQT